MDVLSQTFLDRRSFSFGLTWLLDERLTFGEEGGLLSAQVREELFTYVLGFGGDAGDSGAREDGGAGGVAGGD